MQLSDAFWQVFSMTGHIGAYLLYRTYIRDNIAGTTQLDEAQDGDPWSLAIGSP